MRAVINDIDCLNEMLNGVLSRKNPHSEINFSNEKLVLYGAGDLGVMAIEVLGQVGIVPAYVVDKNINKHGTYIHGVKIISPNNIPKDDLYNAVFIVCIVKMTYGEFKNYLKSIGCAKIAHFYDLTYFLHGKVHMNNGWRIENLSNIDKSSIRRVYNSLADSISKKHYLMMLYWRILHEELLFEDAPVNIDNKFFPSFIVKILTKNEVFVDCGAYVGNTVQQFLINTNMNFNKILAFEPDKENFAKLKNYVTGLSEDIRTKIYIKQWGIGQDNHCGNFSPQGISSHFSDVGKELATIVSLDDVIKEHVSFIKMHLEGMEYKALKGALKIIRSMRPILAITLYHSEEGCYKIPLFLMDNIDDYVYYHQVHMYCGQSSVLYAIPKERAVL